MKKIEVKSKTLEEWIEIFKTWKVEMDNIYGKNSKDRNDAAMWDDNPSQWMEIYNDGVFLSWGEWDKICPMWERHLKNENLIIKDKEKLFDIFLEGYLENVKKELPESYRAQQLKQGGLAKDAVYEFETRFLKQPFMKAIEEVLEE